MLQRDKENLELRLKQLREEAKEDFFEAQQVFAEEYEDVLAEVFADSRPDLLSLLKAYFEIGYVYVKSKQASQNHRDILETSLKSIIKDIPILQEKKTGLLQAIQTLLQYKKPKSELYHHSEQIQHHPYFPIIEDMALDGDISREEFYALEYAFIASSGDIYKALERLPSELATRIKSQLERYIKIDTRQSEQDFRAEYNSDIQDLKERGIATDQVLTFVARSYYKNPGRYKKYEHPKRRLKRTFKLALLRLLRKKLGMIDAENIMKRFEEGETFLDLFHILFELLEVLPENPQAYEVYHVSNALEQAQDALSESQSVEEKILTGQKVTTGITRLIGDVESEMESDILEKYLDDSTDIVGQEIYFRGNTQDAGVLAEGKKSQESDDDENDNNDEEKQYDKLSPRGAFEAIREDFLVLESEKTKAFLDGRYDDIDIYNERLFTLQKKLEKLALLLGEEL